MCKTFDIRELKPYQREAIVQFVRKKTDVVVNLLTGCAKSLIYQASLSVFDSIFEATSHVVVVALPLVNFLKDQVDKLANLEILSTSPCDNQ